MKKIIVIIISSFIAVAGYSQNGTKARSAKSGQYVTKDYANKNPSTTVVEKTKPAKPTGNTSSRKKK